MVQGHDPGNVTFSSSFPIISSVTALDEGLFGVPGTLLSLLLTVLHLKHLDSFHAASGSMFWGGHHFRLSDLLLILIKKHKRTTRIGIAAEVLFSLVLHPWETEFG